MIFCTLLSDNELLEAIKPYNSATIVYCVTCTNISVAYQKNLPIYEVKGDEQTGAPTIVRRGIVDESIRIKEFLDSNGIKSSTFEYNIPCLVALDNRIPNALNGAGKDTMLLGASSESEAVLALCCSVGILGLKRRITDGKPIVAGMKTHGISSLDIKMNDTGNLIYADENSAKIIQYTK
jgi:hypothetical protein